MAKLASFTIELEEGVATALIAAAKAGGWAPETLIAECVATQLETAIRHRVLIERLETMDEHLLTLAEFVGQAAAGPAEIDVGRICRYRNVGDGNAA